MSQTTIVPVKLRDIMTLHRLFTRAVGLHFSYFPAHYRRAVLHDHRPHHLMLAAIRPRRIVLVAYHESVMVGYAIGSVPRTGHGQLYWLYVDPARRGENLGLALLSRMLKLQQSKGADEVTLATYDHRRYYERQGFRWVEHRDIEGVSVDVLSYRFNRGAK